MGGHPLSSLIKPVKFTFFLQAYNVNDEFLPHPHICDMGIIPPAPMLAHVCSNSFINSWHNTWNHTTIY